MRKRGGVEGRGGWNYWRERERVQEGRGNEGKEKEERERDATQEYKQGRESENTGKKIGEDRLGARQEGIGLAEHEDK